MTELLSLIHNLQLNGSVIVNNFIPVEQINSLKDCLQKKKAFSNKKKWEVPYRFSHLFIKLLKLDIFSIKKSYVFRTLNSKNDVNNICDLTFKKKTKIHRVDGYISKKNNDMIIPWHCDTSCSGASRVVNHVHPDKSSLKLILYLTDVESNNGCLGFVPGSHKIVYALKMCFLNKEIEYEPFWSLKDARNIVKKEYVQKKLTKYLQRFQIEKFLDFTKFIEETGDTYSFDKNIKAGSALLFNELGFHRAASPMVNDRYIFRYFFN
jgi:ectoine hydroxylase-related dioxygenase (phytanoyl-CoA dioxygenase family)